MGGGQREGAPWHFPPGSRPWGCLLQWPQEGWEAFGVRGTWLGISGLTAVGCLHFQGSDRGVYGRDGCGGVAGGVALNQTTQKYAFWWRRPRGGWLSVGCRAPEAADAGKSLSSGSCPPRLRTRQLLSFGAQLPGGSDPGSSPVVSYFLGINVCFFLLKEAFCSQNQAGT